MDTYGNEDILHISLPCVLSTEKRLALHYPLCLLLCLICEQGQPRILNVQLLTPEEARTLVPLLQSFPAYAPYALVLASVEKSNVEEAQKQLNTAWLQGEEAWAVFLQPLRTVLGGLRQKLHSCDIDLVAVQRRGYLLKQWKVRISS